MCTLNEIERICRDYTVNYGCVGEMPSITVTIPMDDLNKIYIFDTSTTPTVFNTSKDFRENIVDRCLAEIEDICIYNDRAVIIKFKDGTYTKAECTENDCFDLDMGLLICFIRKALCDTKENRNFRKFMRKLHKFIKNKEKEELKKEEEIQKTKAQKKRNKMDDLANIIIRAINGSALSKQRMEDSNNE